MTEQVKIRIHPVERCPLCGEKGSDIVLTEHHEFAYAHAAWSYLNEEPLHLRRCHSCGFGYTGALPPKVFFEEVLYSPMPGAPPPLGADAPGGKEYIFRHILKLFARHGARGRLVDLGCSGGRFLWHARANFERAEGIENDSGAAELATRHGIQIRVGAILALLPSLKGEVDAITLIDVLEHLPDPLAHLAGARDALKAGGFLYVKVPHQWGQLRKERLIAALGMRPTRMAVNFVHINHFSEA